jgi:hypothetical protein
MCKSDEVVAVGADVEAAARWVSVSSLRRGLLSGTTPAAAVTWSPAGRGGDRVV